MLVPMRELWEELCALPHRGTATAMERLAAQKLQSYLEAKGHSVQAQSFATSKSYGPELIFISCILALAGGWGLWWLALLGTYGFWAHFSGWWVPWHGLFERARSQNLLSKSGSGSNTLVLMAHYDSAKTLFVYNPKQVRFFRRNFLINAGFATVLPFATFLPLLPTLLGLYFAVQALLMFWRELTQPYVNGANDNASGVAVAVALFEELALEPPADTQVILALTGAEEVGAKGAEALLGSGEIPSNAKVLNIDNVGKGTLFYACGEGMLVYHPYRGKLLEQAALEAGAKPLEYRLAFFDTRPFAARGMDCLTLIRLENGLPPHWHWPSDTAANVDFSDTEATLEYARRLVRGTA